MSSFWNVPSLLGYPTPLHSRLWFLRAQAFHSLDPTGPTLIFFSSLSPQLWALSNFKPRSPSLQVVSCILGCFFASWATRETELVKSGDEQGKEKRERETDTTLLHSISKKNEPSSRPVLNQADAVALFGAMPWRGLLWPGLAALRVLVLWQMNLTSALVYRWGKWVGELPWRLTGKELASQCRRRVQSLGGEDPLEEAWAATPVFLPGKPHGQRSQAAYSPWGHRVRHDLATKRRHRLCYRVPMLEKAFNWKHCH